MPPYKADQPHKRIRLSRACNQCRLRKVRCDEHQPSCSNCLRARVECVTTNPKKPTEDSACFRRRAGSSRATVSSSSPSSITLPSYHSSLLSVARPLREESVVASCDAIESPRWRHNRSADVTPHNDSRSGPDMSIASRSASHEQDAYEQRSSSTVGCPPLPGLPDNGNTPEFAINTAGVVEQKYLGSTSLQVFSQWLEMTCHKHPHGLSSSFQLGMRFCEEMDIPDEICMPPLPSNWRISVDSYFSGVGRVFPIVSKDCMYQWGRGMSDQDLRKLPRRQRPSVAILYTCMAIGEDTLGTNVGVSQYLGAACSLYAYLVAQPYLQSAQALLLICLALRGRNKDGAASQALGQAIRIMHSIGLHRRLSGSKNTTSQQLELEQMGIHTWWSAYCLERITSLETGRPSHIHDDDIDQEELVPCPDSGATEPLRALVGLARIQGKISMLLSNRNIPTPASVLRSQGELDQYMSIWQKNLPESLQPNGDLFDRDAETVLPRAFLAIQFHSTMIILHRVALLMDRKIHLASLARFDLIPSHARRLMSSESICTNSARKMITTYLEARDISPWSRLQTMTGPLMAVYVLAINVLKNSTSWSARSDLSLIQSAAEAIEQRYFIDGQDPGFYTMLKVLKQFASQVMPVPLVTAIDAEIASKPLPATRGPTLATYTVPIELDSNGAEAETSDDSVLFHQWNTLFPHLYLGDMGIGVEDFQGMDIEHLMGIPDLTTNELVAFNISQDPH